MTTAAAIAIPDDVGALKALVRQLHEALHASQRKVETLEHRLDVLLKSRFGPRADRLDPKQLLLFAQEVLAEAEKTVAVPEPKPKAPSGRRGHGRRRLPADLPRQQVVHDLTEEEKACPCCGERRVQISAEVSEQLEYEPAKLGRQGSSVHGV